MELEEGDQRGSYRHRWQGPVGQRGVKEGPGVSGLQAGLTVKSWSAMTREDRDEHHSVSVRSQCC